MKNINFILFSALAAILLSSCGNANVETVRADSSMTSASIAIAPMPAAINTDTSTAAPVADTVVHRVDTPAHKTAVLKKTAHKKDAKSGKQKGKKTKK